MVKKSLLWLAIIEIKIEGIGHTSNVTEEVSRILLVLHYCTTAAFLWLPDGLAELIEADGAQNSAFLTLLGSEGQTPPPDTAGKAVMGAMPSRYAKPPCCCFIGGIMLPCCSTLATNL